MNDGTKVRKKILVADGTEGQTLVRQALSEVEFELVAVETLKDAQQLLSSDELESGSGVTFSMVIAGLHFDESRMFELLQYIRSVDHFDKMSFLVIQTKPSLTEAAESSLQTSAKMLGACQFLNLVDKSMYEAARLLREAVSSCADKPVERERADGVQRIKIPMEQQEQIPE